MSALQSTEILALLRHRLQVRSQRGLGNRFDVVVVILLPLDERSHVDRRDDPRFKSQTSQRSADKMRAETRLHPDHASRQGFKGGVQRQTLDPSSQDQSALRIEPNQMKDVLADVDANHRQVRKVIQRWQS